MLEEFQRRYDVDFALLQEATSVNIVTFKGYQTIDNIGTSGRGTAIIAKVDFQLLRMRRLPLGRGLVAYYNNICLLNIYAPSGTSNRAKRETFFNSEVIELLPKVPTELIMAGDFNCVQTDNDCTGHRCNSRTMDGLLHGLRLTDVWDASLNTHAYTHYTPTGAARLDRIYVTDEIRKLKQGRRR